MKKIIKKCIFTFYQVIFSPQLRKLFDFEKKIN